MLLLVLIAALLYWSARTSQAFFHSCFYSEAFNLEAPLLLWLLQPSDAGSRN